jgi:hypothetical protein
MALTLLGIVEKSHFKSGPGAKLRPICQASLDKNRWVTLEETFPNSGLVSWWQPLADAEQFNAWIFQVEQSRTYDPKLENHDLYSVRQVPSPAVELIDLDHLEEPEDVRLFLLREGLPVERCATKRLMFRDRNGLLLGPLDLSLRDDRLFIDDRETPVAILRPLTEFEPLQWGDHVFLAPENPIAKIGDLDISSNALFLKRMLRESRDVSPAIIEKAKLTERLIGSYCSALEQMSPETSRRQRLRRLTALSASAINGIPLEEEGVSALLAIPSVVDALEFEKKKAASSAVEERRSQIQKLEEERTGLEDVIRELKAQLVQLRQQIKATEQEQTEVVNTFNASIAKRFQEVTEDAPAFLGTVALIRAALADANSDTKRAPSLANNAAPLFLKAGDKVVTLEAPQIIDQTLEAFKQSGFDIAAPSGLLSAWASGFVPLVWGTQAKEMLDVASSTLTGGKQFGIAIPPTLSSPSDLLILSGCSRTGVGTLAEFLAEAGKSDELFLLVLDNLNLCQIDNVIVPLLKDYASGQLQSSKEPQPCLYPTQAGMWPKNVLLAGILVESPLALSMSRDIWQYSCLVEYGRRQLPSEGYTGDSRVLGTLKHRDWIDWRELRGEAVGTSTQLVAKHVSRVAELNMLHTAMLCRLASLVEQITVGLEEEAQLFLFARIAIVPLTVAFQLDPHVVLKGCPIEITVTEETVNHIVDLFRRFGMTNPQV